MNPDDVFQNQREAFRRFICGLTERQLEHLSDDIKLRLNYLENLKPEHIIERIMPE